MEAARANIPATWTWARRTINARLPTTTKNNKNNDRNNNTKYIMPNINNAKSSKSPNSGIANSPSDIYVELHITT